MTSRSVRSAQSLLLPCVIIGAWEAVIRILHKVARVASDAVAPVGDIHASPAYRRSLFGTLVERALIRSMARTSGGTHGH